MNPYLSTVIRQRIHPLVWVIALEAMILLMGNSFIVPDIMESRNLITAREMVDDGHWLIPTMNGEFRLAKPPLPTWISAVNLMLTGNSWAAQRIPAALIGLLMLYWLYALTLSMTRNRTLACVSAVLLGTCTNFLLMAKTISWDIYCHTFMLGAIYYLWLLLSSPDRPARHALLAGILTGMSIMSKGPVALYALFLPCAFSLWIMYRRRANQHLGWLPLTVVTALVCGCLWYAYVAWSCYEEGIDTLHRESGSWMNHSIRPWWYYITFFVETGIWAPLCIVSLAFPLWKKKTNHPDHYLFSLLWMATALILLSILPEKKNRYLLPVILPAALAMAHVLVYWFRQLKREGRGQKRLFLFICIIVLLVHLSLIALGFYAMVCLPLSFIPSLLMILLMLLCIAWDMRAIVKLSVRRLMASVMLGFVSVACGGMPLIGYMLSNARYSSPCPLIDEKYPGVQVFSPANAPLRIELVYDIRRKVTPLPADSMLESYSPCLLMLSDDNPNFHFPAETKKRIIPVGYFNGDRKPPRNNSSRPSLCYQLYYLPSAS